MRLLRRLLLLSVFGILSAYVLLQGAPPRGSAHDAYAAPLLEHPGYNFDVVFAKAAGGNIAPCRALADPYPAYNSVAVDPKNHVAVLSDNNLKSLLVYDLSAGSKDETEITPFLNQIKGPDTHISGASSVAVDPVERRLYFTDTDIGEALASFPYGTSGNVHGEVLAIPVACYGLGLSRNRMKKAVAMEDTSAILMYRLHAQGAEPPLYQIRGEKTELADPHGLYWDDKNHEIATANHGNWNRGFWDIDYNGGGRYTPASILVFDDNAKGNVAPLRVIQGSNTQLDWPYAIAVDTDHDEIAVANYMGPSVLIFKRTDKGNVVPIRVLKGPRSGITGPMGVAFDQVNNELWVTNFGHTALVFDRTASGDAEPKRIIRSAPPDAPASGFSNPYSLAFDTKRNQLLVRN